MPILKLLFPPVGNVIYVIHHPHFTNRTVLSHFLQLNALLLCAFLKQCSPWPANCSSYQNLKNRYMLVSKRSSPITSPTLVNVVSSPRCPWTWQVDSDANRLPTNIVYAKCGSACHQWYCSPVKYHTIVLEKNTTRDEWKLRHKRITVAYVYIK